MKRLVVTCFTLSSISILFKENLAKNKTRKKEFIHSRGRTYIHYLDKLIRYYFVYKKKSLFCLQFFQRTYESEKCINIFCEPKKMLCYGFAATYNINNNNDDDKQKFYFIFYHSYNYYDCIEKIIISSYAYIKFSYIFSFSSLSSVVIIVGVIANDMISLFHILKHNFELRLPCNMTRNQKEISEISTLSLCPFFLFCCVLFIIDPKTERIYARVY